MVFYRCFAVQGRETLIDVLASVDRLGLPPVEIVERVMALGDGPDVTRHPTEMWHIADRVFEVCRDGRDFLVPISRDAEISDQALRADADLPIERVAVP